MKAPVILLIVLVGMMPLSGCRKATVSNPNIGGDHAIEVDSEDSEMNAAIARARAELDTFLEKVRSGEARNFSVKIPIKDETWTEYFWLKDVAYNNGIFTGRIDDDPEKVRNVKLGDPVNAKKEEITDWLYMKDGKMYGNYTMRVLLKKMSPEEVSHWKRILAE